jgi:hypothetical protein
MSDEENKGFTVNDKRAFDSEGNRNETETPVQEEVHAGTDSASGPGNVHSDAVPDISFSTFVYSLASAALVGLGIVKDPGNQLIQKNLILAKQNIDILGMLQDKTKGNLSEEEEQLINALLYDVRMRYVQETTGQPTQG